MGPQDKTSPLWRVKAQSDTVALLCSPKLGREVPKPKVLCIEALVSGEGPGYLMILTCHP